ncbi:MAG: acyl-CoA thioesterase [Firmicutes bacterium]|nr:acyl-CoA thioesterase [Bacillota bacterium]
MEPMALGGDPGLAPRSPAHSRTEMTELVLPSDANQLGNILGGRVMHWVDLAAAIAAARHAGRVAVTASMDRLDFLLPVKVGQVVSLVAEVNWAGRTSMEVGVEVYREELGASERELTSRAYLTFVAIDADGRPVPVPPLLLTRSEEVARFHAAEARRQARLAHRARMREEL